MESKTKSKKIDAQVAAGNEIYNIARKDADAEMIRLKSEIEAEKEESRIEGYLAKVEYDISHNEFLRLMALYKMKQTKDYKKGGRTWVEFCEAHGYPQRTADRLLEELKPIFNQFSCQLADFFGISFNKIRLLGRSVSANLAEIKDGCLVYDDQLIPLDVDHKDEIEAVIDQLKDDAETAKKEKALEVKAKDRVLNDKEKAIQKLHKTLEKLEGQAREKNLTPEEDGFLKKIEGLRLGFDGYMLQLDPERMEELSKHNDPAPTPRMRAAYLSSLDYMKKQILIAFEVATELYGNAIMCPEAAWKPGMGAAITPAKELSKKSK